MSLFSRSVCLHCRPLVGGENEDHRRPNTARRAWVGLLLELRTIVSQYVGGLVRPRAVGGPSPVITDSYYCALSEQRAINAWSRLVNRFSTRSIQTPSNQP